MVEDVRELARFRQMQGSSSVLKVKMCVKGSGREALEY